jgi:hypothetical protein
MNPLSVKKWHTVQFLDFRLGRVRKTMKYISQNSSCPSLDSNWIPPEYQSRALLLHQLSWFLALIWAITQRISSWRKVNNLGIITVFIPKNLKICCNSQAQLWSYTSKCMGSWNIHWRVVLTSSSFTVPFIPLTSTHYNWLCINLKTVRLHSPLDWNVIFWMSDGTHSWW